MRYTGDDTSFCIRLKLHRAAIIRPIRVVANTTWRDLFTFGYAPVFIVFCKLTKSCLTEHVVPLFEHHRSFVPYVSPYLKAPKRSGRSAHLDSVDLVGLASCYLRVSESITRLSMTFGAIPSSASVWLNYGLELMLRFVRLGYNTDVKVKWPSVEEIDASARLKTMRLEVGTVYRKALTYQQ